MIFPTRWIHKTYQEPAVVEDRDFAKNALGPIGAERRWSVARERRYCSSPSPFARVMKCTPYKRTKQYAVFQHRRIANIRRMLPQRTISHAVRQPNPWFSRLFCLPGDRLCVFVWRVAANIDCYVDVDRRKAYPCVAHPRPDQTKTKTKTSREPKRPDGINDKFAWRVCRHGHRRLV